MQRTEPATNRRAMLPKNVLFSLAGIQMVALKPSDQPGNSPVRVVRGESFIVTANWNISQEQKRANHS